MRHDDRFTHATDRQCAQCAQPYKPGSQQRNAPTTRQSGKPKNRYIHGSAAVPWILPVIHNSVKRRSQAISKRVLVLELTPRFIFWWREEGPWHHPVSSRITLSVYCIPLPFFFLFFLSSAGVFFIAHLSLPFFLLYFVYYSSSRSLAGFFGTLVISQLAGWLSTPFHLYHHISSHGTRLCSR